MTVARVSVAVSTSRRGSGLGNEVFAWAKAYLCAQQFGLRLLPPEWTFNRYGLLQEFGHRSVSGALSRASRGVLPEVRITERMFRDTGQDEYGAALRALDSELGLSSRRRIAVVHEGMWGGYLAIRNARPFLWREIYSAPGVVPQLGRLALPSDRGFTVAVHVRRGDFAAHGPDRGKFNAAIPLVWYQRVVGSLTSALPEAALRFLVFSDAPAAALRPLLALPHVEYAASGTSAVQDLAAMAACDLLVCSVSSFSLLAAFLSRRRYIWYEPQLTLLDEALSLWGSHPSQESPTSPTRRFARTLLPGEVGRGVPVSHDGHLPSWLQGALAQDEQMQRVDRDLLYYGSVPTSTS